MQAKPKKQAPICCSNVDYSLMDTLQEKTLECFKESTTLTLQEKMQECFKLPSKVRN
jgi:hypothetical protein